jgi:phosphosulfolactate phosphohydrolase-like enzyme
MWRALALIIQVNYQVRSNESCAILIDDIGEGLDYARAKSMIGLLIERAKTGKFQLIMTTNDRFIMNEVPLDYWSVAERTGKDVRLFNSSNSKESFENFKYAGLSNFEFFKNANFTGN